MKPGPVNSQTLYRNVLHLLKHGLRTATYKLATVAALVDFCVDHRPIAAGAEQEVPLADLARLVMNYYWRQSTPFDGVQLRQSTQSRSRILDAVNAVRAAADTTNEDLTLEKAAQLAPEVYRRAVDGIAMCLAQQPLPRLQRLPGAARSVRLLYDDSFLSDTVTRSQLQRHNNAIRLYPGVSESLADLKNPLHRALHRMWVADVLRINRLPPDKRRDVELHLFGHALLETGGPGAEISRDVTPDGDLGTPSGRGLATSSFAARLNYLFERNRSPGGEVYSSGEVAARLRESGFSITASTVSQLRAGVGPAPQPGTARALAMFFGVAPSYFLDNGDPHAVIAITHTTESDRPASENPREGEPSGCTAQSQGVHVDSGEVWNAVVGPDLNDIAARCDIDGSGCWLASSNTAVRCRPPNDMRASIDLPKIQLHRWAWMVANGHSADSIPTHLLQVRRRCNGVTCCNPSHLFASRPGAGEELSEPAVAALLQNSQRPEAQPEPWRFDLDVNPIERHGTVLTDDLESVYRYCISDDSDCWLMPTLNAVSCRAAGDLRRDCELPKMSPHRWAWMVANGLSSNPLPGDLFQVWRHCGRRNCCNPEHLYLIDPDGEESTAEEAEEYLRFLATDQPTVNTDRPYNPDGDDAHPANPFDKAAQHSAAGGRHRAATPGGEGPDPLERRSVESSWKTGFFTERLNELFESRPRPTGEPLTSNDVAAALQADGLAVTESLISRLRNGSGAAPAPATIEALAYFFDVDVDSFSAGAHATVRDVRPTNHPQQDVELAPPPTPQPADPPVAQVIQISVAELGRTVTGLSRTAAEGLTGSSADVERAGRLLSLVADLGALLSTPMQRLVISRPLLRRIVTEWTAIDPIAHLRHPIVSRLTQLLNE